jgi:hypothetical protein
VDGSFGDVHARGSPLLGSYPERDRSLRTRGLGQDQEHAEAVVRRDAIRDAWIAEGSPLLGAGSTGQLVEHPLLKMLREHDVLVMRLEAVLRKRHAGPEPSAVIVPSIGKSPATKLRAVGD